MQISEKLIQMSARGDIAPMSSKDALAIEAALSAAEPVATVAEMGAGGMRVLMPHPPGSADHLPIGTKLYAAPPAPSVAVKDWSAEIKKLREYRRLAYNTGFLYLADWMEEMAAALSAQVQDVAGWQPIETAPTDGSPLLLRLSNGEIFSGWGAFETDGSKTWRRFHATSADVGWINARHWMPLPAAPAKQED